MSTLIRPELSPDNKYYISRHRFYELKHFCLQYPEWKTEYLSADSLVRDAGHEIHGTDISDPVFRAVERRERYRKTMEMVEQTAIAADGDIYQWLLKAVCYGTSYTELRTKYDMPCGKDLFYDRYRRFFWLLDRVREKK